MNSRDRNRNKVNNIALKFEINKNKQLTRARFELVYNAELGLHFLFLLTIFMRSEVLCSFFTTKHRVLLIVCVICFILYCVVEIISL